jgi:hypothetical protein
MWSVGVVLHVVLTGRNPFNDEDTMWEQIAQVRRRLLTAEYSVLKKEEGLASVS